MVEAEAGFGRLGLEFAVAAVLLAHAWRGMVGQQEFVEGFAGGEDAGRGGLDFHVRLALANACSLISALAAVDDADTADSDGGLVLLVAEGWDRNAV